MEAGGTLSGLYTEYVQWLHENYPDEERVSDRFYSDIFTSEYNILFKQPKQDTCSTCDSMAGNIAAKEATGENVKDLKLRREEHEVRTCLV